MNGKIRLKTKIMFSVLLVNFFLVLMTAYAAHSLFTRWYKRSIEEQQMMLITRVAEELDGKIEFAQETLVKCSKQFTPAIVADPVAADQQVCNNVLLDSIFDGGLFLFTATGRIITETVHKPPRRGRDLSYREYIQNTLLTGKPYISHPFISSPTNKSVIMFTTPVYAPDGKVIAILGGSLNLQKANFLGRLAQAKIGKTGYFFLFNRHRTMIMHPDPTRIIKNDIPPGVNKRFDQAVAGVENSGETINSRGIRTFQTFKNLKSVDWVLATDCPVQELYTPIRTGMRYALLILPLGAFLSALVTLRVMKHLTAPILSLTEQIQHVENVRNAKQVVIRSGDEIEELAEAFNSLMSRIGKKEKELYHMSTHDNLTSLYNRGYFETELERRAKGRNFPLGILAVDVDGLKHINDAFGHAAGDRLIKAAARILQKSFRSEDVVARVGGDEFSVLIGEADEEVVAAAVLRVRKINDNHNNEMGHLPVSLSIGAATAHTSEAIGEALILADQRMYAEKSSKKLLEDEIGQGASASKTMSEHIDKVSPLCAMIQQSEPG